MAVLMEFNIFSISGSLSKKAEVAKVLKTLQDNQIPFELNPMGTIVECESMPKALKVLKIASENVDAKRFYVIAKFDCYEGRENMLQTRVQSTLEEIKKSSQSPKIG